MAYCDVHRNLNPRTRDRTPFIVDVQADILSDTPMRVVVPLLASGAIRPIAPLNPEFIVAGVRVLLAPQEIVGIDRTTLGPVVASLEHERDRILRAVDFVLTGA